MVKKEVKSILGFNDRWVLLLGIPIMAFLIPILFFNATRKDGLEAYLPEFTTSLMFTIGYWIAIRQIIITMRRRFPGHRQTRRRLIFTAAGVLVAFVFIHTLLGYVHDNYVPHPDRPGVSDFNYMVASLTIILLVAAVYEGIFFYDRWRESAIEQERLRRENIESQLAGLREQVNPHFLFNSLNTLVYLIPEDTQRAVEFVRKLSKVYRYVLEIRDRRLISLDEELAFLESYIFLVKERFGNNLIVEMAIPEAIRQDQIVPLSLQMLFENAVKHNIISAERPLTIRLFLEGKQLIVSNDLQIKNQGMTSTGVGLENIRSRYAFFCDEPIVVNRNEREFRVGLPLLKTPLEPVA